MLDHHCSGDHYQPYLISQWDGMCLVFTESMKNTCHLNLLFTVQSSSGYAFSCRQTLMQLACEAILHVCDIHIVEVFCITTYHYNMLSYYDLQSRKPRHLVSE